MPIDLASVNWIYVGVLAIFAFLASLVGNLLTFGNRGMGAVFTALIFAALFVAWSYYPHNLPLPTSLTVVKPAAEIAPPAARPAPARPANPVTTISPPPDTSPPAAPKPQ